jgi:hypothetical protein
MAKPAVTRERLFALRETIAKLEGEPAPALAAEESQALTEHNFAGEGGGNALRLPLGIPALDEATDGGVPLDGSPRFARICCAMQPQAAASCWHWPPWRSGRTKRAGAFLCR